MSELQHYHRSFLSRLQTMHPPTLACIARRAMISIPVALIPCGDLGCCWCKSDSISTNFLLSMGRARQDGSRAILPMCSRSISTKEVSMIRPSLQHLCPAFSLGSVICFGHSCFFSNYSLGRIGAQNRASRSRSPDHFKSSGCCIHLLVMRNDASDDVSTPDPRVWLRQMSRGRASRSLTGATQVIFYCERVRALFHVYAPLASSASGHSPNNSTFKEYGIQKIRKS